MKKVLSIVLAIAMIASMSAVAFAAAGEIENPITAVPDETTKIDVAATYTAGTKKDTYKVTIAWEDFTYGYGSGETWNPETHKWDLTTGTGEWDIEEKTITVTNDSSLDVLASAAYEGVGTLDFGAAKTVDAYTKADTAGVAELSATWAIPAADYTIQENTDLGTITVTIAAVEPAVQG